MTKGISRTLLVVLSVVAGGASAVGQVLPWDVFDDALSNAVCDVVNAENAELVVLSDTGQLAIVTGRDVILDDTFVTAEGDVLYFDQPAGFITYDTDGDGLRSVWWVSLTGQVVSVDGFTGEPTVTNMLPTDFVDVPCNACDFWDDPTVCLEPDPVVPPVTINLCGTSTVLAMSMTLIGLVVTGLMRRRYG